MVQSERAPGYPLLNVMAVSVALGLSLNAKAQTLPPLVCTGIDNFQSTSLPGESIEVSNVDPGPAIVVDNAPDGVLGGFRNITYGPYDGFPGFSGRGTLRIGLFASGSLSNSNGVNGFTDWSILYNANGAGLGLDLSATTSISVTVFDNDQRDTSLEFVITDSSNNSAQSSIDNLPNRSQGDPRPADLDFNIADFTGVSAVDLSDIASIEMRSDVTLSASDLTLTGLQLCAPFVPDPVPDPVPAPVPDPAPEPVPSLSTWSLLLLVGFLGLVGVFRIKRGVS